MDTRWALVTLSLLAASLGTLALGSGCAAGGASGDDPAGDGSGGLDPSTNKDDGLGSGSPTGGSGAGQCATYSETAENALQPTDIILAIDQSGSMDTETAWVKDQLNGFAQQVMASGIDVRVVVIAGKPGSENGFCVPAPLGSGSCPADDNPPALLHVDRHVDSSDSLYQILQTYDLYRQVLRPEATKNIVVISDDDSDLAALAFDAAIKAKDPSFADYTFHAIVATDDDCPEAADDGKVYMQLVALTQGVLGDLCLQNFQPVWDELSTQVTTNAKLACQWAIPEPPPGETFDPAAVNVMLTIDGAARPLGYVASAAECDAVAGGWFYDDPVAPTLIQVCPDVCAELQGAASAAVRIELGCARVSAPLE